MLGSLSWLESGLGSSIVTSLGMGHRLPALDTICQLKGQLRLERQGADRDPWERGTVVTGLTLVTEELWGYGTLLAVSSQLPESLVSRINRDGKKQTCIELLVCAALC